MVEPEGMNLARPSAFTCAAEKPVEPVLKLVSSPMAVAAPPLVLQSVFQ